MRKAALILALSLCLGLAACAPGMATTTSLPPESAAVPQPEPEPMPLPAMETPVVSARPGLVPAAGYTLPFTGGFYASGSAALYSDAEAWFIRENVLYHTDGATVEAVREETYGIAGIFAEGLLALVVADTAVPERLYKSASGMEITGGATSLVVFDPATGAVEPIAVGAQQAIYAGGWFLCAYVGGNTLGGQDEQQFFLWRVNPETGEAHLLWEDDYTEVIKNADGRYIHTATRIGFAQEDGRTVADVMYPGYSEVPYDRYLVFDEEWQLAADSEQVPVTRGRYTLHKGAFYETPGEVDLGRYNLRYPEAGKRWASILAPDGAELARQPEYSALEYNPNGIVYFGEQTQISLFDGAEMQALPLPGQANWPPLYATEDGLFALTLTQRGSGRYAFLRLDGTPEDPMKTTALLYLTYPDSLANGYHGWPDSILVGSWLVFTSRFGDVFVYNTHTGQVATTPPSENLQVEWA